MKSDANKGIDLIEYDTFLDKVKQITWTDGRWLKFFYDGAGTLLKRQNSAGDSWEYASGMIYKNGTPYQLTIPEGRAVYENGTWVYEFEYRDVWGNLRQSFAGIDGRLVSRQRSDFDALGFEYNSIIGVSSNHFKYQKQERIEDFNLGVDFFKYRVSDPVLGRFWSLDPLASDYVYNSPYAFQENKFGRGVELEGLELAPLIRPAFLPRIGIMRVPVVPGESSMVPITQKHHLIPNGVKNHRLVKEARQEGFKQDGKENKIPVERFDKESGEGQHGNHPKYNQEVTRRLDKLLQDNPSRSEGAAAKLVRGVAKNMKETIQKNPEVKINDLFKMETVVPVDNTRANSDPNLLKKPDPCADNPNCI